MKRRHLRIMSIVMTLILALGFMPANVGKVHAEDEYTVTMIESLTSPERTEVIRGIADQYEEENEGITIEIISPPLQGADQKIAQMLQSEQKLDLVEVRDHTVKMFMNNEWIQPLNSYLEDWDGSETLTETTKQSMSMMGDDIYLVPYGFYQRSLFYRKDWFEEAGLEVPTTWEELYEVGKELTDPSENRFGWSFRGGDGGVDYIDMLYWDYIGYDRLADPYNAYFMEDGTTIFSQPEALEALEFYKENLYKEISPPDSVAWSFSEMVQGFIGGTTAMLIQDPEVIASCQDSLEDDQWGIAVLPYGPSGTSNTPAGYAGWGLTSYSEKPDISADFLLFLSNEDNNTHFAREYSTVPIHQTASDIDPYFEEGPFSVFAEMDAEPDTFKHVLVPQGYEAYAEHRATADEWYQKYLTDAITAEECLEHFDTYWLEALEEEGKIWED